MGTVALSNRTQLFVSSHLLLAANACSASLSPQSLAQGPKPTVSVLAHCCSTLWVQLHATQLHPSPRLSSLTLWVQLHATQLHPSPRLSSLSHWVQSLAEQPHPPPRLSSLSHWAQLHAEQPHPPPHLISSLSGASPRASVSVICRSPQTTMKTDARSTLGEEGSTLRLTTTERRLKLHTPP
jgi:hypothetical protein